MAFLAPTRRKLVATAACFLVYPIGFALRTVPPRWDLLDLRELGGLVLGVALGWPLRAFDALTGSAFATSSESFLAFPSGAEMLGALALELAAFYLIACVWTQRRPADTD